MEIDRENGLPIRVDLHESTRQNSEERKEENDPQDIEERVKEGQSHQAVGTDIHEKRDQPHEDRKPQEGHRAGNHVEDQMA